MQFNLKVILIFGVFLFVTPVFADEYYWSSVMNCDAANNKVMIRFYNIDEGIPMDPSQLIKIDNTAASAFLSVKPIVDDLCLFSNGSTVQVSVRESTSTLGMDGGDPDAFFTLKIADKNIYYDKKFYSGYGASHSDIAALVFDGQKLFECHALTQAKTDIRSSYTDVVPMISKECVDASWRMSGDVASFSKQEKVSYEEDQKRKKLSDALSPFCKEFMASNSTEIKNNSSAAIVQHNEMINKYDQMYSKSFVNMDNMRFVNFSSFDFDIANNGTKAKVFQITDATNFFEGSFLIVMPQDSPHLQDFINQMKMRAECKQPDQIQDQKIALKCEADADPENIETEIKDHSEWNALLISVHPDEGSIRYTYNSLFTYKNKNYIYSGMTNTDLTPSAYISFVTHDYKLQRLCAFP